MWVASSRSWPSSSGRPRSTTEWIRENIGFIATRAGVHAGHARLGGIVLAITLALVGALGRLSRNPIAYGVSGFYTSFFRGTPLIVQLFLFYMRDAAGPRRTSSTSSRTSSRTSFDDFFTWTAFQVGIVVLGLNYGAYMTEIFRAGIQSVSHGQAEAADALGMTYRQKMRRVVLPQAVPGHHPADGQRVHRDDEGHGADLRARPIDRDRWSSSGAHNSSGTRT